MSIFRNGFSHKIILNDGFELHSKTLWVSFGNSKTSRGLSVRQLMIYTYNNNNSNNNNNKISQRLKWYTHN